MSTLFNIKEEDVGVNKVRRAVFLRFDAGVDIRGSFSNSNLNRKPSSLFKIYMFTILINIKIFFLILIMKVNRKSY